MKAATNELSENRLKAHRGLLMLKFPNLEQICRLKSAKNLEPNRRRNKPEKPVRQTTKELGENRFFAFKGAALDSLQNMPEGDVVATWNVPLHAQVHRIEFEHGTTTGKRIIRVDGNEILRRDWMFKLVGKESFKIGDMKCIINVEALGTFAYEYSLDVNGKTFNKFKEEQNKRLHSWETTINGHQWRVVLDKESMEIWANGNNIDTAGEFVDNGTVTHFELGKNPCKIVAQSSGKKKTGVTHVLYVNGNVVASHKESTSSSNPQQSSQ